MISKTTLKVIHKIKKVKPFYHNLTQEQRNTIVAAATVSSYANLNEFVSDILLKKAEVILKKESAK